MTTDWTPVDINHLGVKWSHNPNTYEQELLTNTGENIIQWLRDNQIQWTLQRAERPLIHYTGVLLFKREEDAVMFLLRWA